MRVERQKIENLLIVGVASSVLGACANLDSRIVTNKYELLPSPKTIVQNLDSIPVHGAPYSSLGEAVRKNGIPLDNSGADAPYNSIREIDYPEELREYCKVNDRDPSRKGVQMTSDEIAACVLKEYLEKQNANLSVQREAGKLERLTTSDAQSTLSYIRNQPGNSSAKILVDMHDSILKAHRRGENIENYIYTGLFFLGVLTLSLIGG